MPSLAELVAAPTRMEEVPPEEAARLLVELSGLTLALAARVGAAATTPREIHPSVQPTSSEPCATLLTAQEAADLARVSPRVIYGWARRADWRLFAHRLSRKVLRIEASGFRRWLASRAGK